ncbi:MAG: hypothetical protein ACLQAT_10025 [Candidatus Binataceae bacterium]
MRHFDAVAIRGLPNLPSPLGMSLVEFFRARERVGVSQHVPKLELLVSNFIY